MVWTMVIISSGDMMNDDYTSSVACSVDTVTVDGVLNFRCSFCERVFNKKANCKIHTRKHTGELPYTCPYVECGKKFMWKSSLNFHQRNVHLPDFNGTERKALQQSNLTRVRRSTRLLNGELNVGRAAVTAPQMIFCLEEEQRRIYSREQDSPHELAEEQQMYFTTIITRRQRTKSTFTTSILRDRYRTVSSAPSDGL